MHLLEVGTCSNQKRKISQSWLKLRIIVSHKGVQNDLLRSDTVSYLNILNIKLMYVVPQKFDIIITNLYTNNLKNILTYNYTITITYFSSIAIPSLSSSLKCMEGNKNIIKNENKKYLRNYWRHILKIEFENNNIGNTLLFR